MVVVLVVSIVRKVDQSEWDCSLTKKTSHCKSRALFTRKAPTKNDNFLIFDGCMMAKLEYEVIELRFDTHGIWINFFWSANKNAEKFRSEMVRR